MANTGVFHPVDPQSLEGPFSGALRPPTHQSELPRVEGPVSTLGGIATAATAFLDGATKGRIKSFEEKENQKLQRLQALNGYVTQIANDPNLTDEAKQFATQRYYRAVGGEVLEATGKGGKGGKGKGDDGGAGHHFTQILKDLATGMVGGKAPKGAPDVGGVIAEIQSGIYGPDGKPKAEYHRPGQIDATLGKMREAIGKLPDGSYQEDAIAALGEHIPNLRKLDPLNAESHVGDLLGRYQRRPAPGSPGDFADRWGKIGGGGSPAAGAPAHPPAPPPGPPTVPQAGGMSTQGLAATAPPATPAPPPGIGPQASLAPQAKQGRLFTPQEIMIAEGAGMLGKLDNVEYDDAHGKPVKLLARTITLPQGTFMVDANGRQLDVDAARVRKASTAEAKPDRYTTPQVVKGRADLGQDPKKWYRVAQGLDDANKRIVVGEAPDPNAQRPRATPQETAANRKLDREIKVGDAIAKIMQQTLANGGFLKPDGSPLEGAELARAVVSQAEKHYMGDSSVAPLIADIAKWGNVEARLGTLKGDYAQRWGVQREKLEDQQKTNRRDEKLDAIQGQVDTMFGQMFKEPGGGTSYDEIEK